jgi:hypothetical protein
MPKKKRVLSISRTFGLLPPELASISVGYQGHCTPDTLPLFLYRAPDEVRQRFFQRIADFESEEWREAALRLLNGAPPAPESAPEPELEAVSPF